MTFITKPLLRKAINKKIFTQLSPFYENYVILAKKCKVNFMDNIYREQHGFSMSCSTRQYFPEMPAGSGGI